MEILEQKHLIIKLKTQWMVLTHTRRRELVNSKIRQTKARKDKVMQNTEKSIG